MRILQVELGSIENDLNFDKMRLDDLKKGANDKIFDYYESLVQISSTYPYGKALDEMMSLGMYIAENKGAIRRNKPVPQTKK